MKLLALLLFFFLMVALGWLLFDDNDWYGRR